MVDDFDGTFQSQRLEGGNHVSETLRPRQDTLLLFNLLLGG